MKSLLRHYQSMGREEIYHTHIKGKGYKPGVEKMKRYIKSKFNDRDFNVDYWSDYKVKRTFVQLGGKL